MYNVISDLYADTTTQYNVNRERYSSGYKATRPEHHSITPEPTYYSQSHLTGASYVDTTAYNSHINEEMNSFSYNSTHSDYYKRMKAQSIYYNRPYTVNPVNHPNQSTISYREQSKKFYLNKVNSSSEWSSVEDSDGDEMLQLGCLKVEKKESHEVKTTRREFGEAEKTSSEPQGRSFGEKWANFVHTYKDSELLRLMAKDIRCTAADASSKDGSPTDEKSTTPENAQEYPGPPKMPGEVLKGYSSGSKHLYTSNSHKEARSQEYTGIIGEAFSVSSDGSCFYISKVHKKTARTVSESYNSHSSNNAIREPSEPEHNVSISGKIHKSSSGPEGLEPKHNTKPPMPDLNNVATSNEVYKPFEPGPFKSESPEPEHNHFTESSKPRSLIGPSNIAQATSTDNERPKGRRKAKLRGARRRKQERRLQEAEERGVLAER